MMKFKLSFISCMLYFLMVGVSNAEYYNSVNVGEYSFRLTKENRGNIEVRNFSSGEVFICAIKKWDKRLSKGAGGISLTSDKIGLLLHPGNKYLKVADLLVCDGKPLSLYSIPDPDGDIDTVVDVNFEKKIFLSIVLIDVKSVTYQAKVAYFGSKKNIFSGKAFWGGMNKKISGPDDYFTLGDTVYLGKISSNGVYVSPNDLDCATDSFPGVWDIEKKKKVVFESNKDGLSVDEKCSLLFSGKKISLN